jgi:hypothetical protein
MNVWQMNGGWWDPLEIHPWGALQVTVIDVRVRHPHGEDTRKMEYTGRMKGGCEMLEIHPWGEPKFESYLG